MKSLLLVLFSIHAVTCMAQTDRQDLTKAFSSPERAAILEALKLKLKPNLKQVPKLIVTKLAVRNGYAYFVGNAKAANGKDIDFRKTVYREEVELGVFDGDSTNALLKKIGGKWKVLDYAIGPTNVPWGCWWKTYKAPKDIFDYAEKSCN